MAIREEALEKGESLNATKSKLAIGRQNVTVRTIRTRLKNTGTIVHEAIRHPKSLAYEVLPIIKKGVEKGLRALNEETLLATMA